MIISLLGYMGCGKSHVSINLSRKINFRLVDLDEMISNRHQQTISEIFEQHGEIYFRKVERTILEEILATEDNIVLSLGGGTPVYYDNIHLINRKSTSFFLRASVGTLAHRVLLHKNTRPLIANLADSEVPEYIAKHLFERNPYYSQAHFTIDTDFKTATEVSDEIVKLLGI